MTRAWVAHLPIQAASRCAHLRLVTGLRVAAGDGLLWLHGDDLDDELGLTLRKIAGLHRFDLTAPDRLVPADATVPTVELPELAWESADSFFRLELPRPTMLGAPPAPLPARLVRSAAEQPAAALLVELAPFHRWVDTAPARRLETLAFACRQDGTTLVCGDPLPPLPGLPLWRHGPLLIPCGFTWDPPLRAEVLAASAARRVGDGFYLLHADGSAEAIAGEDLVHCTRAAVRQTLATAAER